MNSFWRINITGCVIHAYLKVLWLFIIPFESKASIKPNKIYFTHNKENNIHNTVRASMFQKLLAT